MGDEEEEDEEEADGVLTAWEGWADPAGDVADTEGDEEEAEAEEFPVAGVVWVETAEAGCTPEEPRWPWRVCNCCRRLPTVDRALAKPDSAADNFLATAALAASIA